MPVLRIYILTLTLLCTIHCGYSQCPFSVSLSSRGNCPGDTLAIRTDFTLIQIVWLRDGVVDKVILNAPADTLYKAVQPGSYTASVSDNEGCTVTIGPVVIKATDNSNASPVSISPSEPAICSGMPVNFTATSSSNGAGLTYQWMVNGVAAGGNDPLFTSSSLSNGDVITCVATNMNSCAASTSNSVAMVVNASPSISTGPPISLSLGKSVVLQPTVNGDINSYLWSPAAGLSDSHIEDPVAMPLKSTLYTLNVETLKGCKASGEIMVNVFSPVYIQNAFTPNGDGKNDVFYILGGPEGSRIKDFSIFNRWGQKVFQRTDVPPGDPAFGWNGYYNGSPAMEGAYVYKVIIRLADGSSQLFQGTVVLIR